MAWFLGLLVYGVVCFGGGAYVNYRFGTQIKAQIDEIV